jgi:UDP-glucose 4-epimerase
MENILTKKTCLSVKRVLVLGGLGFVGRHLCRAFTSKGLLVYALGHGSIPQPEINAWGIHQWVDSSISLETLILHFKNIHFDAVIHCAGSGSVSLAYQQPLEDYHRSVTSVLASLEFVRATQTKETRFVLASSAAVYGNQNSVLTESSKLNPISPYGLHKQAAENICAEYSNYFDVKCSVVRLFSVYGAGLQKQLLWDAANKFKNGKCEFFGTGNEMRDWIHVEDAVQLLSDAALKNQKTIEIYNGCNQHASTYEVLMLLASSLYIKATPRFNGEVHIGNPISLVGNHEKSTRLLKWIPRVSLKDGLIDYAKWFNNKL